jgi:hypothetical protein
MKNNKNSTNRLFDEERFDKMLYRVTHPQKGDSLVEAEQMMDRFREKMAKEKFNKNSTGKKDG